MDDRTSQGQTVRRRRRIVERPRLTRALDASQARVRMLIAPAGYGKTILAEQWSSADGRLPVWYAARTSSADVAVLSTGIGSAAAGLLPGCDRRLRERLTATPSPGEEAALLAEMLGEDLAGWPSEAWLVIDDYHLVARTPEAETFVQTLVASSPVNVLIASRRRPSWVSSRTVLYGEVFELGQTTLAMSTEEAQAVLAGWRAELTPGLIALADGWPAVIGLAGVAPAPGQAQGNMPETVYDFFAEEVYQGLEPDVRVGLGTLAVAPSLDRELAVELLGAEHAERVLREALRMGICDERGGRLELHPLARTFLEARTSAGVGLGREQVTSACLEAYRARRDWDSLFDLIERNGLESELERLLGDALDELLDAARLATVEMWVTLAEHRDLDAPIFRIARAELSLRQGRHVTAQTLAEGALKDIDPDGNLAYRALRVAGSAAHVDSREEEALVFYRRAEAAATNSKDKRDALWGQVMCASALELEEAHDLLALLIRTSLPTDPREIVRLADKELSLGFRFGFIRHLDDARRGAELVASVSDPFSRCSFRSMHSCALALTADYERALTVANELVEDATRYRVDLAVPYGLATRAVALAGLRQFDAAHEALDEAWRKARQYNDSYGEQNVYAIRLRVLLQEGRPAEACAIEPPNVKSAVKGMRGEVLGSRGLALACLGRLSEATELADEISRTTRAIEATNLVAAIRAVVAVKSRDAALARTVDEFLGVAYESGAVDIVITCYRASTDVLAALLDAPSTRERTVYVLARAGDHELVDAIGRSTSASLDPRGTLSVREKEVYDLLCQGLSNREIGRLLFITEATVKAHVHHVFDKLGIRSRTALALNAAQERSRQAAPARASEPILSDRPSGLG